MGHFLGSCQTNDRDHEDGDHNGDDNEERRLSWGRMKLTSRIVSETTVRPTALKAYVRGPALKPKVGNVRV